MLSYAIQRTVHTIKLHKLAQIVIQQNKVTSVILCFVLCEFRSYHKYFYVVPMYVATYVAILYTVCMYVRMYYVEFYYKLSMKVAIMVLTKLLRLDVASCMQMI